MNIVGISAHFHDSSCCLLQDGQLVAAASEEAFSRIKHDPSIPREAFRFCLQRGGIGMDEIDAVAYYENTREKLGRQLWMGLPQCPSTSRASFLRLDARRAERDIRQALGYAGRIWYGDHHRSHAASAYLFSGFEEAAILTVDAVGEWTTTAYGLGRGGTVDLFETVEFPHSIGLLYSAVTQYLGFEVNEGEYKIMGLAPLGAPTHTDALRRCLRDGGATTGQFELALEYFDFSGSRSMAAPKFCELLGREPRAPGEPIEPFHCDVARSMQLIVEEFVLDKARYLHSRTGSERLCMAGGVALNCVANGRLRREGPFREIFIQPAATDAGSALGVAALAHVDLTGGGSVQPLQHVFLGPAFEDSQIGQLLRAAELAHIDCRDQPDRLLQETAKRLADGKVVGWFQGSLEFGPRALGGRSILADPRLASMRDHVNAAVKKRESFRPFAPAVLAERAAEHFEMKGESQYMLFACRVCSTLDLPAITHVDGSARIQTVSERDNPRFHSLLREFARQTGCPVLLNTSFNLRGEPIVCSPVDAMLCFVRSDLDCLVLGSFLIDRAALPQEWRQWFGVSYQPPASGISESVYTLL